MPYLERMICVNVTDLIKQVLSVAAAEDRLKAQLRFACRLSSAQGGVFDELLAQTCEWVLANSAAMAPAALTAGAEERLQPMAKAAKAYELHCVAHAHIDMNWQWGTQETAGVTLDTFRTMLQLMDEYPAFTFSQSQASTYAMCEEYDPALFARVVQRVKEGRWEVTASTWTEADKNLPSGESLTRQHLYTKQYMHERFGLTADQLCLDFEPDTFGHSAHVPEILTGAKVKYYYHCRGQNLLPAYRFRAPSGAEVLCYQDPFFYNAIVDSACFEQLPTLYNDPAIHCGLYVYGVGDHGGGPSRRDIERILAMSQWPIAPTIRFSTYAAFFAALEQYRDRLPVVDTERNFIFTGCYSSQARIKAGNRLCEDRLYTAETVSALAGAFAGGSNFQSQFRKAWELVLFNQFHDILPGSCVRDSREYAMGSYQQALGYVHAGLTNGMLALADAIDSSAFAGEDDRMTNSEGAGVGYAAALRDRALHTAAEYGRGKTRIFHVFNPTAFDRDEAVSLTVWDWPGAAGDYTMTDADGKELTVQRFDRHHYWGHECEPLRVQMQVPAFGYTTVVLRPRTGGELPPARGIVGNQNHRVELFAERVLENDYVRAEFDEDMCLVSLVDKTTGAQRVREPAGYFEYFAESSRIHMPNAWSEGPAVFTENMNRQGLVYVDDKSFETPVGQAITYHIEYKETKLDVTVTLDRTSRMLTFNCTTDWRQNGKHGGVIPTMRFKMPLAYEAPRCRYDVPMGVLTRPALHHDVPGHAFGFAPADDGAGVALLCDTQSAFRCWHNTLSLTLIRATSIPDDVPEYGLHHQVFAVGLLADDWMELHRAAQQLVYPMPCVSVTAHKGSLPAKNQLLTVTGRAVVSAVKLPESGETGCLTVRLYSVADEAQTVALTAAVPVKGAVRTNALEEVIETLPVADHTVSVSLAPHGVATVCLRL